MAFPVSVLLDGLCAPTAGPRSVTKASLHNQGILHARAVAQALARRASGEIGFWELPDAAQVAAACIAYAQSVPAHIDTVVVLGIGGSGLGPRAVHSALGAPYAYLQAPAPGQRRLIFADNIDPVSFAGLLGQLDPKRTLWNVVTKSGGTAETAAQLLIVAEWLTARLGPAAVAQHLVATTDPTKGALRATVNALGLTAFDVPPAVGGRFSVLSPVGLLPAALAGFDVHGLLAGAKAMRDVCLAPELHANPALALAATLHAHQVAGRPMVVMMSYVDGLYDAADWFRQLWAESLGKERSTTGQIICTGPTPIAARGATDQHSQLQLYAEGPDDKAYLFVSVAKRATDIVMPQSPLAASQGEYAYLAGRTLGELLDAERLGTIGSLRKRGRPVGELVLPAQDATSLGALFMLLQMATAYAGPLYDVDAFDQPGVEEAKKLAFGALGRPGFEAYQLAREEAQDDFLRFV